MFFICTVCNVWVHINCTYDIHYSNISSYTSDQKHELGQFLWLHIFIRHRVYRKPIHISSNNNNVQLKTFLYLFVFVTMFFIFLYILGYITIQTKRNGGRIKLFYEIWKNIHCSIISYNDLLWLLNKTKLAYLNLMNLCHETLYVVEFKISSKNINEIGIWYQVIMKWGKISKGQTLNFCIS